MSALTAPTTSGQLDQLIDDLSQLLTYTIGRHADNAIRIPNGKVSSWHARLIQCTPTSFVLEDLDSKNGTFVDGGRITRKVIDKTTLLRLADAEYTAEQFLNLVPVQVATPHILPAQPAIRPQPAPPKDALDFTNPFAELKQVYEQYPQLRRACRSREKMIRTGSVIISSIVGISAVLATGGVTLPLLHVMSGAGLSVLVPTLCSTILSTDEKLELIDKEYRERYRCPNPGCRDPFGAREWELLNQQKTCRRCQAIWVN